VKIPNHSRHSENEEAAFSRDHKPNNRRSKMMRKFTATALFVLLTMALFSTVYASNGTQIGNVGARATAMGSCFRGLADDWSALFFNPAGLTQLGTKWTIGGSMGIIMPRGCYTQDAYPTDEYPFSGMHIGACDAAAQNFFVPSMGIFYKPSESMVFGLGVFAPFGLGTEWDLISLPSDFGNTTGFSKEKEHYSDHQVIVVQPTFAFKISDKISLGLGVSYIWGNMDIDLVRLIYNPVLEPIEVMPGVTMPRWTALQGALALQGVTLPDLTDDQYRLPVEIGLSGDGSAYGVNFGLHFALSEKFSFGLAMRYYTDLKLKGDLMQTAVMHGDQVKYGTLNAVPAQAFADAGDPTGAANKAALLSLFAGENVPETYNDVEADLPLPMTIGGGIAYKPSPKFTLTVDASWTNWATWDKIPIMDGENEVAAFEQDWTSTIEAGFGFEWMVMQKENTQLFLRGGFYTVDTPSPDETMSPTILDPVRRYVFTDGFGLKVGKFAINLAYEYIYFPDKEVADYVFLENGAADNYAGNYSFKAHVITLGTSIEL
jgi:long-chain fatty acid transport protein